MPRPSDRKPEHDSTIELVVMTVPTFRRVLELVGRMSVLEADPLDLAGAVALGDDARAWLSDRRPSSLAMGVRRYILEADGGIYVHAEPCTVAK